jgi:AcrR family transcriptional regulator
VSVILPLPSSYRADVTLRSEWVNRKNDIDITFAIVMLGAQNKASHSTGAERETEPDMADIAPLLTDAAPPTRKGRATRERLLAAAETIFGLRGYEAARVADIVAEANVSHGLFYRHFADKDAVLFAVLTRLYDGLRHTSGRGTGGDARPTLPQLQARNTLFFGEYAQNRRMLRVSREAAARVENTHFRELWFGMRSRFTARTARWLERLAEAGHIAPLEDAELIAEGLSSMTEQLAYVQLGLAIDDPDDELIDRLGRTTGVIWHRTIFGGSA